MNFHRHFPRRQIFLTHRVMLVAGIHLTEQGDTPPVLGMEWQIALDDVSGTDPRMNTITGNLNFKPNRAANNLIMRFVSFIWYWNIQQFICSTGYGGLGYGSRGYSGSYGYNNLANSSYNRPHPNEYGMSSSANFLQRFEGKQKIFIITNFSEKYINSVSWKFLNFKYTHFSCWTTCIWGDWFIGQCSWCC